jgi:hypothetical protein
LVLLSKGNGDLLSQLNAEQDHHECRPKEHECDGDIDEESQRTMIGT